MNEDALQLIQEIKKHLNDLKGHQQQMSRYYAHYTNVYLEPALEKLEKLQQLLTITSSERPRNT